jgi:hypothetical protein
MVLVWAVFTGILFVAEPYFLNAWVRQRSARDPARTFRLIQRARGADDREPRDRRRGNPRGTWGTLNKNES